MTDTDTSSSQMATSSRSIARHLLAVGGVRMELFTMEMKEERARIARALLLIVGVAVFGLLAGMALTALVVVWLWDYSHVHVLVMLTLIYAAGAVVLYGVLIKQLMMWQSFPASREECRKDRACLEELLA